MYRICTEDKNREQVHAILDSFVDGYAVFPGIGSWKGQREQSLTIDLVGASRDTAHSIALRIKDLNEQEAVLLLEIPETATFV